MENVGSPSASDDGTPVQPISSSTPPVPSFPALLGTTVSGLSSSTADVETTPQVAGCGLSSSMAEVQSTPSTSQFAGSGLPSSLSMSGGGLSSSTVDGESAPSTSQVAGSGLSSSTQPQADEAAVSSGKFTSILCTCLIISVFVYLRYHLHCFTFIIRAICTKTYIVATSLTVFCSINLNFWIIIKLIFFCKIFFPVEYSSVFVYLCYN